MSKSNGKEGRKQARSNGRPEGKGPDSGQAWETAALSGAKRKDAAGLRDGKSALTLNILSVMAWKAVVKAIVKMHSAAAWETMA